MLATVLKGLIFPTVLVGSFVGFQLLICAGIDPAAALLIATIVNMAVVAGLELVAPLRRDWRWTNDRQVVNDLLHGALLSSIGPRLGEAVLIAVLAGGAAGVAAHTGAPFWPGEWPFIAQLGLAIIIADFADWAKHWLYHHTPLWRIHALHHNPDRMHFAKAGRLHFLEASVRYIVLAAPLVALGAPADVLLWHAAAMNFLGNLNHSNIHMPIPWPLHLLIATPDVHRLHHSVDPDLGNSNLSALTMAPDHLFGTYRNPRIHKLGDVGVVDDPIRDNLLIQLLSPLIWPVLVWRRRRAAHHEQ